MLHTAKLWSKMRSAPSYSWTEKPGAVWDTAIAGSLALRAALARATLDECARELGVSYATLFLDLQKFYDSISFVLLMKASRSLHYPAITTVLEVGMYAAPRLIKQCVLVSSALEPGKSIVAGSPAWGGHGQGYAARPSSGGPRGAPTRRAVDLH
eukprot:4466246-Pyramimonas_sp.AAC.1